jgi:hypothetical protein
MKLEDITPDAQLSGVIPGCIVKVIAANLVGSDSLKLVYEGPDNQLHQRLLFRSDESEIRVPQLSDRDLYIWMCRMAREDTRWGFGIAEIDGQDWLIGARVGISFPMFKLQGVNDIEEAFHKFFAGDGWKIIEWLCCGPEERFRKAADRIERGGEGVVHDDIFPDNSNF